MGMELRMSERSEHYDLPPVVIGHWSRSDWFLGWFGGAKSLHLGAAERARKGIYIVLILRNSVENRR